MSDTGEIKGDVPGIGFGSLERGEVAGHVPGGLTVNNPLRVMACEASARALIKPGLADGCDYLPRDTPELGGDKE